MVSVDRTGLSDGIYSGTVTLETNGGTATVRLRLVVGAQAVPGADIGVVYVVLVDPDTLDAPANYPFPNNTVATSISDTRISFVLNRVRSIPGIIAQRNPPAAPAITISGNTSQRASIG